MKKIFGYCLFGIFLLCIIHILFLKCGFYYRIMGPSVILNGLEDYYSEEFIITNSEVVKNKKFGADYVSAVDYYISPVSDETISFKVNYTGGTSVSSEHLASYYLAMQNMELYKKFIPNCKGIVESNPRTIYYVHPDVIEFGNGSWKYSEDIDRHTSTFGLTVRYPEGYDRYKAFEEVLSAIRGCGLEFEFDERPNHFDITVYIGFRECYTLTRCSYGSDLSAMLLADNSSVGASTLDTLPLGYNVMVWVPTENPKNPYISNSIKYRGNEFMANMDSILSDKSRC